MEADELAALTGVRRLGSGKVRELYLVDGQLLLVATDRISAYDVVLPTVIPDKGRVLTAMTDFWLDWVDDQGIVAHHRVSTDVAAFPAALQPAADALRGRATLCRRADVFPVECVARGYLSGSGWKDYVATGSVCGHSLPAGLTESAELPEPLFTPATKATSGHDENISFDQASAVVGHDWAHRLREVTLRLYAAARDHARSCGIILADTKFEFGVIDGELVLVDEVLTPDSSRFWPADGYSPGGPQPSFDKQFVRDWLSAQPWDKTPPAPALPDDVVARTRDRYITAYERLSGRSFADWP
jgi:phosphoribosylaminoimidazole-succinocarboxamide synthase